MPPAHPLEPLGMHNSTPPPYYLGHRKRLRDRYRRSGIQGFHDYEVLELLLTFALPRKDTKPLAKELLRRFGTLSAVLQASAEELSQCVGLGESSITLLHLVRDICALCLAQRVVRRDVVSHPEAVRQFVQVKLGEATRESFLVLFLNSANEVLAWEILQEGTVDRAVVYPRTVLERSLAHHATGIILVHNHPSGRCEPSAEDRRLTKAVAAALRPVDIRLLDHLIVGRSEHFSFCEHHLLGETA